MTHNGRTHSHMVTVLPRPERHSTVIPRPVPSRWTRKKRTRKATVPPFPQKSMSEETGDGLDDYDKCILDLAIEQEKLTSVVQAEVKRKQANEKDQEVRLQVVSRVSASATSERGKSASARRMMQRKR